MQQVIKDDIEAVAQALRDGTSTLGTWRAPTKLTKNRKKIRALGRDQHHPMLARVRNISDDRLHGVRHSCATLMHSPGVPAVAIAAWPGHTNATFTMHTYAHSTNAALADAATVLNTIVTEQSGPAGAHLRVTQLWVIAG